MGFGNWRGGRALIKSTWLSWMQDRGFFFVLAFGWMLPPLIYLFVWSSAAGNQTIGGFGRGEFVAYYLILIVVNQLTYSQTNWTVGDMIRSGKMNSLLLRPLSPIYHTLASEIAGKVVYLTFVIPVVAGLALLLQPQADITLPNCLGFALALGLAWVLRFMWGYWLALLAFWFTRADSLLALQDAAIFILAGQIAPVALLPEFIRLLAVILPFRYMVAFPIELLTGQLAPGEILAGFGGQLGWLAITLALFLTVWRKGLKHYTAVGG